MKTKSSKFIKCIVIITGFCLSVGFSHAQNPAAAKRMEIFLQVRPGDTTLVLNQAFPLNASTHFQPNTQISAVMHVVLNEASDFSYIHTTVRSSPGGNVIFQKTFNNAQGIFDNDRTYLSKRGNVLNIGLGNYTGADVATLSAEVYFENSKGELSPVVTYTKQ